MHQIIRRLFLGDMVDAGRYDSRGMHILCVLWDGEPGRSPGSDHIATTGHIGLDTYAIPEKMDEAADWIHARLSKDEAVLVHCAYGIERSPLTIVWYLMRYQGMNLKHAYDLVQHRRPEAAYRGAWLPVSVTITGELPARTQLETCP
ncbi:MAG: dual specificity protein phosphatase [Dehalococcoidia bacterium]